MVGAVWDEWGKKGKAPSLAQTAAEHYDNKGFFLAVDAEISVPTLILCGADDGFTKAQGASLVLEYQNPDRASAVTCQIIASASCEWWDPLARSRFP